MQQFIRYIIVGLLSFGLEYTIFAVLYEYGNVWYVLSNSIAYIIVFGINFSLNRIWSFKSKKALKKQMIQYGFLFVFNIFMSNVLIYVLSETFKISPFISKFLVMGIIVMWNFIIYRKIIYKD